MKSYEIAIIIFFTFNALGNIPLFISLLRKYDNKRRVIITFRESFVALILMLLFCFFGQNLLRGIGISVTDLRLGGSAILFLIALGMMIPKLFSSGGGKNDATEENEPFIVPLAIPILTGPGTISTIMIYAQTSPMSTMVSAILMAWIPSALALLFCSYLQNLLGDKLLIAIERLMGMILMFIAVQMFCTGFIDFFFPKAVRHTKLRL
jgi:multiple antibiotic resistance protein